MRKILAIAVLLAGCARAQPEPQPQGYDIDLSKAETNATTRAAYQSAPAGDPARIAAVAIGKAEHPCGHVVQAQRLADGSIAALCSNHEDFRITRIAAVGTVAMRCSEVRRMGIKGC